VLAGNPAAARLPPSSLTIADAVWLSHSARKQADHPFALPDPREWVVALEHYICEASPPQIVGRELVMHLPPADHFGEFGRQKVVFYRWSHDERIWGFDVMHGLAHILCGDRGNETDAVLVTVALAAPAEQLLLVGAEALALAQRYAPLWTAPTWETTLRRELPRPRWRCR
jgi:hypothetical protein